MIDMGGDLDAEPALCAVVTADEEDETCVKSVSFDVEDCIINQGQGLENTARSSYLDLPTRGSAWPLVLRQGRAPLTWLAL